MLARRDVELENVLLDGAQPLPNLSFTLLRGSGVLRG